MIEEFFGNKIENASKLLGEHLLECDPNRIWFLTVGIADDKIYIYVKKWQKSISNIIGNELHGFPVIVKKMGTPKTSTLSSLSD